MKHCKRSNSNFCESVINKHELLLLLLSRELLNIEIVNDTQV